MHNSGATAHVSKQTNPPQEADAVALVFFELLGEHRVEKDGLLARRNGVVDQEAVGRVSVRQREEQWVRSVKVGRVVEPILGAITRQEDVHRGCRLDAREEKGRIFRLHVQRLSAWVSAALGNRSDRKRLPTSHQQIAQPRTHARTHLVRMCLGRLAKRIPIQ